MALKRPALMAAFLFVSLSALAFDFRSVSWMMSHDQVVASETGSILSDHGFGGQQELLYQTSLNGYAGSLSYTLERDHLVAAAFSFPTDYHGELFRYLKGTLTSQYGPPSFQSDRLIGWRMNRTEIALAFLSGRICHLSYWEKSYFARINNLSTSSSR